MRRKISVVSLLLLLFDEVFVVEEGKRKRAEQRADVGEELKHTKGTCLLYTSPSPRDLSTSRMPSSA